MKLPWKTFWYSKYIFGLTYIPNGDWIEWSVTKLYKCNIIWMKCNVCFSEASGSILYL